MRHYSYASYSKRVYHVKLIYSKSLSVLLYREIFHGQRWHTDFQCPMIITPVGHVFQGDFVKFSHHRCGTTLGKVINFYKKVIVTITMIRL